ncbi:MAG: hypothetical protein ABIO55_10190, partial [Ginsengibacter sp.]
MKTFLPLLAKNVTTAIGNVQTKVFTSCKSIPTVNNYNNDAPHYAASFTIIPNTKHFMKPCLRTLLLSLSVFVFSAFTNFAVGQATIATDALDYPPGSTAIITGTGFTPGETVTLQVLHEPTGGDDATEAAHQPFTTIADGNGNVSSSWEVPADLDEEGAILKLTADGQTSGLHVEAIFTDACSVTGAGTFCAGGDITLNLSSTGKAAGGIFWQYATSLNGTYTTVGPNIPSGASYTGTSSTSLVISGLPAGTYFYRAGWTSGTNCTPPTTGQLVTIQSSVSAGTIESDQTICNGGDPLGFTSAADGTGSGTITYRWERSISPFTTWTTVAGQTAATYDVPSGLTATTQYRRITIST